MFSIDVIVPVTTLTRVSWMIETNNGRGEAAASPPILVLPKTSFQHQNEKGPVQETSLKKLFSELCKSGATLLSCADRSARPELAKKHVS